MMENCFACKKLIENTQAVHKLCYEEVLAIAQEKIKEPIKTVVDIDLAELKERFLDIIKDTDELFYMDLDQQKTELEKWTEKLTDLLYELIKTKRIREPIDDMFVMTPVFRHEKPKQWSYNNTEAIALTYHYSFTEMDRDRIKNGLERWTGQIYSNSRFSYILENLIHQFYTNSQLIISNIWVTKRIHEEIQKGNYMVVDKL